FWGRFADESARTVMIRSGVIGALACAAALILPQLVSGPVAGWAFGGVFLLIGVAEAGVRLGRKTYLVDAAPKEERPLYVAFANTSVGLLALAMGAMGIVTAAFGPEVAIAVLAVMGGVAALASFVMPEANRMMKA
ncbi:MAG: MFS transporter, partial [Alphaproteobacteria bacterium]|nr:MFS transporter [Alphaproteobacteria bacterium]